MHVEYLEMDANDCVMSNQEGNSRTMHISGSENVQIRGNVISESKY